MSVAMCHVIPMTMSSLCSHVILIAQGALAMAIVITPETRDTLSLWVTSGCSHHSLAAGSLIMTVASPATNPGHVVSSSSIWKFVSPLKLIYFTPQPPQPDQLKIRPDDENISS